MVQQEGPHREFAGEALGQRVQGQQPAFGLGLAATGDELAKGPADPAGQAGVGAAKRKFVGSRRRRQRRFDEARGAVEVFRQRGFQRIGDLHRAGFHFQRIQAGKCLALETAPVEVAPVPLQVLAAGAYQVGVDQVLERLGHGASVGMSPARRASSCIRLRTSVWLWARTRRRSVAGPPPR